MSPALRLRGDIANRNRTPVFFKAISLFLIVNVVYRVSQALLYFESIVAVMPLLISTCNFYGLCPLVNTVCD